MTTSPSYYETQADVCVFIGEDRHLNSPPRNFSAGSFSFPFQNVKRHDDEEANKSATSNSPDLSPISTMPNRATVIENVEFLMDDERRRRNRHRTNGVPENVPLLPSLQQQEYPHAMTAAPPSPSYYYGSGYTNGYYGNGPPQQQQQPPPPPPPSHFGGYAAYPPPFPPTSPRNAAPNPVSVDYLNMSAPTTALSLDDIEQSFNVVVNQQLHPLKRITSIASNDETTSLNNAVGGYGAIYDQQPPPPSQPRPSHRRTDSKGSPNVRTGRFKTDPPKSRKRFESAVPSSSRHNRSQSGEFHKQSSFLSGEVNKHHRSLSDIKPKHGRSRSVEFQFQSQSLRNIASPGMSAGVGRPPQHRRQMSKDASIAASFSSMVSDTSHLTVVSQINKSTFFSGYNEQGKVQLNFPTSQVHLLQECKTLTHGHIYQISIPNQAYEEYHEVVTDVLMFDNEGGCGCDCAQCLACRGKTSGLPPSYYVIPVRDDLYKSVVHEICQAYTMPCGLFYCGHHEDVDRPSINIAVVIIVLLFCSMGAVAYLTKS
jgi:hypothetical protein